MPYKGGHDKLVTRSQLLAHVEAVPAVMWPRHVMIHNTYMPNMAMEDATPGGEIQRLKNLGLGYYKTKGWAGPHLFAFNSGMTGLGCPLNLTGVGSPSYNSNAWHIEMVANFAPGVDDDDVGKGFTVKDTACFAAAVLLHHQGLPCNGSTVLLHKEDPRTTHKTCPGSDIEKTDILARIRAYMENLGEPGEHEAPAPQAELFKQFSMWVDSPLNDPLNVRDEGGLRGKVVAKLERGVLVTVVGSTANAGGTWYKIASPAGWVYGKLLTDKPPPKLVEALSPKPVKSTPVDVMPDSVPSPAPKPVEVVKPVEMFAEPVGMNRPKAAFSYYVAKGLPDYKAAAAVGRFQREAYPTLRDDVWGDKHTAWGLMQVRGPRLDHMIKFAAERQQPTDYLYMQLDFFLEELATSKEVVLARSAWNAATDLESAVKAMMHYERPRGYNKDHPERGDGYIETMNFARTQLGLPPLPKIVA